MPRTKTSGVAGERTRFRPGQTGNPGGRPKKKPLSEALAAQVQELLKSEPHLSTAQAMAKVLVREALGMNKDTKGRYIVAAFKEIADRVEGRVPQPITGSDGGPVAVTIINHVARPKRECKD